jgi:hypothetical protein
MENENSKQLIAVVLLKLEDKLFNETKLNLITAKANEKTFDTTLNREIIILIKFKRLLEATGQFSQFEEKWNQFVGEIQKNERVKTLLESRMTEIPYDKSLSLKCDKEIIDEIESQTKFDHPSKIPPKAVSALLQISHYAQLSKNFPKDKFSEMENDHFVDLLETLRNTPHMFSILTTFKPKKNTAMLEELIPSAFRSFFIDKDEKHFNIPAGITKEAVELVTEYLTMMKNYEKLSKPLAKAHSLLEKYETDSKLVQSKDKLKIAEIGQISKLARFNNLMTKLPEHPALADCRSKIQEACEIMGELEEILMPAYNGQYRSGDLLGYSGKKKEAWNGKSLGPEEKLTMYIADYNLIHGMKTYHSEDEGDLMISHIYSKFGTKKMDLYEAVISDGWRLDITRLIPKESRHMLQVIYGDDWKNRIQSRYHTIEQEILSKTTEESAGITNDDERRINAGLADFHRIINLFGGIKGQKVKGHKLDESEEQDFSATYSELLRGSPENAETPNHQICSEFASKATLVALMQLNHELQLK